MSYFGKLAPCIALTVGSLLTGAVGQAATIAFDSAADAAYSDANMNGRNGGTGFGAWNVVKGGSDWGGSYTPLSQTGDKIKAFCLNGSATAILDGYRPFTGGALTPGQSVVLTGQSLDNTETGGISGFALTDASNTKLVTVYAKGNDAGHGYYVDDASGTTEFTGVLYNYRSNLDWTFTLGNAGAYTLTATGTQAGGTKSFFGTVAAGITQFDLVGHLLNSGGNGSQVESLAVVPEPASIAVLGLASISLLARRRRA